MADRRNLKLSKTTLESNVTPTGNKQQGEEKNVDERVQSPNRVGTQDTFGTGFGEELERNNDTSLDDDSHSLRGFIENVKNAQGVPWDKVVMEENEEDPFIQDVDDVELEKEVENQSRMIQNLRSLREDMQNMEGHLNTGPTRPVGQSYARSRSSSRDAGLPRNKAMLQRGTLYPTRH